MSNTKPEHAFVVGAARPSIAECVLLAGGLSTTPLVDMVRCSVLDLWITPIRTVLGAWIDRVDPLCRGAIRVVHGGVVPNPKPSGYERKYASVIEDPQRYRGPAGVIRDVCGIGNSTDNILVGEAAIWIGCELDNLINAHVESGTAVTFGVNSDNTPAGVYVIRREALGLIGVRGFMDLKEQWLPMVAESGLGVNAYRFPRNGTFPMRTLGQLLSAARTASSVEFGFSSNGVGQSFTSHADSNQRAFSVICDGAKVEDGAEVIDSIVMPGSIVGRGAVIARAVVTPGARVMRGEVLVDGAALCTNTEVGMIHKHASDFRNVVKSSAVSSKNMTVLPQDTRDEAQNKDVTDVREQKSKLHQAA